MLARCLIRQKPRKVFRKILERLVLVRLFGVMRRRWARRAVVPVQMKTVADSVHIDHCK